MVWSLWKEIVFIYMWFSPPLHRNIQILSTALQAGEFATLRIISKKKSGTAGVPPQSSRKDIRVQFSQCCHVFICNWKHNTQSNEQIHSIYHFKLSFAFPLTHSHLSPIKTNTSTMFVIVLPHTFSTLALYITILSLSTFLPITLTRYYLITIILVTISIVYWIIVFTADKLFSLPMLISSCK